MNAPHTMAWGNTGRRSGTDGVSQRTSKWDSLQINRTWEGLWALALWPRKRRTGRQQASARQSREAKSIGNSLRGGQSRNKCQIQLHWTFREEMSKWQQASTTRGVSWASFSKMMRAKPRGKWSTEVNPLRRKSVPKSYFWEDWFSNNTSIALISPSFLTYMMFRTA